MRAKLTAKIDRGMRSTGMGTGVDKGGEGRGSEVMGTRYQVWFFAEGVGVVCGEMIG